MTLQEYIEHRGRAGVTLTAAVTELSRICSVGERSVWNWVQGRPAPGYVVRLMTIWSDCTPDQRRRWFA